MGTLEKLAEKYKDLIDANGGLDAVLAKMKEKYVVSNKLFLLQMFLFEQGVNPSESYLSKQNGKEKSLVSPSELMEKGEGARGVMEVVIGLSEKKYSYEACSICLRKAKDGVCPVHGLVDTVEASFVTYVAASGEYVFKVKVPPRLDLEYHSLTGKKVRGLFSVSSVGDSLASTVFMLHRVYEVSDIGREGDNQEV